jgi:hypothetical protein
MRRYLLDTGIAQDFINRRKGVLERVDAERHGGNRIDTCTHHRSGGRYLSLTRG